MEDCVSIRQSDGLRISIQKRLLLRSLSELFHVFKENNENVKIGLSEFCQLRPPYCVSAGSTGTHVVCMCLYHENVKIMLEGLSIKDLTKNSETNNQIIRTS